ncbi:MAG TPA: hypothetical protein VFX37_15110 [Pseudolabrys sp.]|nr:hypothetical protein [Pseudolabrys sp.]
MPLIRFADYRADVSDYLSTSSRNVLNVVPQGDGYGPFPAFASYTQALPAACRGAFYALKSDGSVITFAGTSTKLYQLDNSSYSWTDVSSSADGYSALSATANWQFAQCGNLVFATQANAVLQVFDLSSDTAFSDALGSPPQAAYISVVGPFLVLSGLLSQPYRIQWSGLNTFNSSTAWTSGDAFSDFQDFPDGGIVRGIAGGTQAGIIFQDQVLRQMAYVPGSPIVFQIDKVTDGLGIFAPYSIVKAGGLIFFFANQGFYKIAPGLAPEPIGRERVDRTFLANLDRGNLQLFTGAADPRATRIYWAYKSSAGDTGAYDKLLGYDYLLDRFFPVQASGQSLLGVSQSGITLEQLDAIAPTPLTITGAADNGSGNVRLTLSAESNSDFDISGQNTIEVYGVTGTTEANGNFQLESGTGDPDAGKFTIVDTTTIDLGVAFTNEYVSGGQIGGSVDAMVLSFDDYATAVQPQIGQFDTSGKLGFFSGSALEATIETGEQGTDWQRLDISGFKPITDASTVQGSIFYRDTQQASPVQSAETGLSRLGRCDIRRDARYARFQVRIPAGTTWTNAVGIVPDLAPGAEH